jgi:hypothetical protein
VVEHGGLAGHAVEFVEQGASAGGVGLADGDELDDEDFAGIDFNFDFLANLQAVEKRGGRAGR